MEDDKKLKESWYKLLEEFIHHNNVRAAELLKIKIPDQTRNCCNVNVGKKDRRRN